MSHLKTLEAYQDFSAYSFSSLQMKRLQEATLSSPTNTYTNTSQVKDQL